MALAAGALCAGTLLGGGCGGGSTDSSPSGAEGAAPAGRGATAAHARGSGGAAPRHRSSSSSRPAPSPASVPQDRPPFTRVDAGIASTLHAYFEASAGGDFEGVCETLVARFRAEAAQLSTAPGRFNGMSCGEILAAGAGHGRGAQKARESLGKSEIVAVQYAGERAIVHVHRPGYSICTIPMQREEGRWLVASLECRFG
jgi:hypothetical protein